MNRKEIFQKIAFGKKKRSYTERVKRWARISRNVNLAPACPVCGLEIGEKGCPKKHAEASQNPIRKQHKKRSHPEDKENPG